MVVPLDAVTAMLMVLAPTLKATAPDGLPDGTVVPLTLMVASGSLVVGVTVNEVTVCGNGSSITAGSAKQKQGLKSPGLMLMQKELH